MNSTAYVHRTIRNLYAWSADTGLIARLPRGAEISMPNEISLHVPRLLDANIRTLGGARSAAA